MDRYGILAALLYVLAGLSAALAEPLRIYATDVPLHEEDETVTQTGDLRFLGGLRLTSPDQRFGGLSGLAVSPDGRRLSFVTDGGAWIRAVPRYDSRGRLVGIKAAEIGPLLRPDGRPVRHKREADAESLSRTKGGLIVSFEHRHRFWVYGGRGNPFLSPPAVITAPKSLRRAAANKGIEAATILPDGRLFAVSENFPANGPHVTGWVRERRLWRSLSYERTALFHPVGATTLPGGDLLILERRFTYVGGFATRLVRVPIASLRAGRLIRGQEVARLEPPLVEENFEGVDVWRDRAGRTLVYLVSDDNFFPLQKTLLLLFELRS